MKLTVVQWTAILGSVFLVLVALHWALSSAPKPTYVAAIKPSTNATNLTGTPPVVVSDQDSAAKALAQGQAVFFEPVDPTLRGQEYSGS